MHICSEVNLILQDCSLEPQKTVVNIQSWWSMHLSRRNVELPCTFSVPALTSPSYFFVQTCVILLYRSPNPITPNIFLKNHNIKYEAVVQGGGEVCLRPLAAHSPGHRTWGGWKASWRFDPHLIHSDRLMELQNACRRRPKWGRPSFFKRNSSCSFSTSLAGSPLEDQGATRSLLCGWCTGGHYLECSHVKRRQKGRHLRATTWIALYKRLTPYQRGAAQ